MISDTDQNVNAILIHCERSATITLTKRYQLKNVLPLERFNHSSPCWCQFQLHQRRALSFLLFHFQELMLGSHCCLGWEPVMDLCYHQMDGYAVLICLGGGVGGEVSLFQRRKELFHVWLL